MEESLKVQIDQAIAQERPIKIRAYAVISETEGTMSYITETILSKYDRLDIIGPVYTALKELSINGAKANIKQVLFEELGISMDNDKDYASGMNHFKTNLTEAWILEYGKKAEIMGLYVDISFNYNPQRLLIEVINNRPISEKEDVRIRQKFQTAMEYDNIAEFYIAGGDSSEGAGMGIVLITMLLKAQGIDPHLFTLRSNYKDITIAKVEIPLAQEYKTARERFEATG